MSGRLGKVAPAAGVWTELYTVGGGIVAYPTIMATNRGATIAECRVAITEVVPPSTPNDEDYIEYSFRLPANGGIWERAVGSLSAGEIISVYASTADTSFRAHGPTT